jgi:hypothetical protein
MNADRKELSSQLVAAFEEDHARMTRGLELLYGLLERDDLAAAVAAAERLDAEAGPHIDFEESAFYPELRRRIGDREVDRLYGEHDAGRRAVAEIRRLDVSRRLDPARRQQLLSQLDVAREHAFSCGTLLSHLDALDAPALKTMMGCLEETRRLHRRWTEVASARR